MQKFDQHPDVLEWSSEEIIIPYRSPIDGKTHRYFPDFYLKRKAVDGSIDTLIIEVKPLHETAPPKVMTGKPTRRYLTEVAKWGINSAKWEMARQFCASKGWKFEIITERELGLTF